MREKEQINNGEPHLVGMEDKRCCVRDGRKRAMENSRTERTAVVDESVIVMMIQDSGREQAKHEGAKNSNCPEAVCSFSHGLPIS